MAKDLKGLSAKDLKRAVAYNASMEKAAKNMAKMESNIDAISSKFLGIKGGDFFRDLTQGEIGAKMDELNSQMAGVMSEANKEGEILSGHFADIAEQMNLGKMDAEGLADKLGLQASSAKKLKGAFNESGEFIGDIDAIMKDMGPDADKFLKSIQDSDEASEELKGNFNGSMENMTTLTVEADILKDKMANVNDKVLSMGSGLAAAGAQMKKGILKSIVEFDTAIKKSQQETGINFSDNTTQMAMLTSETQKFGMGVAESAQFMGELSSELRTTNFAVLEEATMNLAAMQKATGLASGDIAKIAKEFMKFGKSSEDLAKFGEETMQMAVGYGVNGKAVMQDMANNLSKMRTMGFVGGEQSLRKMVLESKRLGMSVDDIFETGKRARNIEGAMEMAADLQLAGGSFAAINPMDLLSAARKGPAEMQKLLGGMGKDIGAWVKDKEGNEIYQFDPIDTDRLQMVSDATGQTMESLTNMIAQNAEDVKKADLLGGLGGSLDGMDDEEKAFLMSMTTMKDGKLEIAGEMEGITDLSKVSKETVAAALKTEKEKKASLAEQAEANMGFQETLDNLKASVFAAFSIFQPVLQAVTNALMWLNNSLNGWGKLAAGIVIILGGALFGAAKWILQGINFGKGFKLSTSSMFSSVPGVPGAGDSSGTGAITETANQGGEAGGAASGAGGGLKGLAEGLKAMGNKKVFKGILAMALLAPVMLIFVGAIPGLFAMTLVGMVAPILTAGFFALSRGVGAMGSNLSNIAKGSVAMLILGLALIPFAYAAMMMGETDWLNVLIGVGIAILVVALLTLLGFGIMYVLPWLLLGAYGLIIAGVALLIAAVTMGAAGELLSKAVVPLEKIGEADWTALLPFAAVISEFGFSMVFGALGLLAGAVALYFAAPLLAASVEPLKKIADTNWDSLKSFADALSYVGPAMLGFALSGLLLLHPAMLLGLVVILGALSVLGSIMSNLAPDLSEGADGIERMAEGVLALDTAVKSLDLERLSKLRNIAVSMAVVGPSLGKAMSSLGGGGGERKVTHIVKLQLDGRQIQEIILRDTEKSS
jgi:hypothetical protein